MTELNGFFVRVCGCLFVVTGPELEGLARASLSHSVQRKDASIVSDTGNRRHCAPVIDHALRLGYALGPDYLIVQIVETRSSDFALFTPVISRA